MKNVKQRVGKGFFLLGLRRVGIQVILTGSNVVLARMLAPEIFGTFGIIFFLVSSGGVIANFGLGAAIIQNQGGISTRQLRTIFTILVLSALGIFGLINLFAPLVMTIYGKGFTDNIVWLRLFSTIVIFNHMGLVSSFLLERELRYKELLIGDLATLITTQVTTVVLASRGFGLSSFVWGNLVGGIAYMVVFFALRPWSLGLDLDIRGIRKMIKYGINYQIKDVVGIINGSVVPVLVGAVSGPTGVGLVNWASGVKQAGLAPLEVVDKLMFSAVSRTADDLETAKQLVTKLVRITAMLCFPMLVALLALGTGFIDVVYSVKWRAGMVALDLSLVGAMFTMVGTLAMDVLLAMGKSEKVRNVSVQITVVSWGLAIPLVWRWGFNGVIVAGLVASVVYWIPVSEVKKLLGIKLLMVVLPYAGYALLAGGAMLAAEQIWPVGGLLTLLSVGGVGAIVYWGVVILFEGRWLLADVRILVGDNLQKIWVKNGNS